MEKIEAVFLDAAGTIFGADSFSDEGVVLFADAASLLAALKSRCIGGTAIKTGLITNWGRKVHRILAAHGLRDHFDVVVTADDVSRGKPSAEPFELAALEAGVEPGRCLFVGDSLHDDAFGAFDAGFQALWLNRKGIEVTPEGRRMLDLLGHPVCSSLEEVYAYLVSFPARS